MSGNRHDNSDDEFDEESREPISVFHAMWKAELLLYFTPNAGLRGWRFWVKAYLVAALLFALTARSIRNYICAEDSYSSHYCYIQYECDFECKALRIVFGMSVLLGLAMLTPISVYHYVTLKHYWRPVLVWSSIAVIGTLAIGFTMYLFGALVF